MITELILAVGGFGIGALLIKLMSLIFKKLGV